MMDILGDMDVWDIVSGTETLPAIETLQPDWQKKDRKALRAIRVRVTPEVINVVQDVDSSRTAWESLRDEYQASGSFGRVMARRKLFRTQCPEGGDIEQHLRTMRSYRSELNTLGGKISEEDFSTAILMSLPDTWRPFVRSINDQDLAGDKPTVTSSILIARILQEYRHEHSRNDPDTALAAQNKSKLTCYACGKKGHFTLECRST